MSLDVAYLYGFLCTPAYHILDAYVAELRSKTHISFGLRDIFAYSSVLVGAVEYDGLVCNVGHHNVADADVAAESTATKTALEPQARIGAREGVIADHNVTHSARKLGAYDETSVGVENGVVTDEDVVARAIFHTALARTGLEADAVVAHVDHIVHYQYIATTAEVYAVAILCIPRTAYREAVNDDISATRWDEVELGCILECHTREEDALTVGETHQVGAEFLLRFGATGNIGIVVEVVGEISYALIPVKRQEFKRHLSKTHTGFSGDK